MLLNLVFWMIVLYIAFYTFMFAKTIYNDGNRIGAFATGGLLLLLLILPFFIKIR